eukprot:TRINITY_DN15834_c0_g1_i1.p1 TRINITY_DN15834_c0_g1~~TRINITY_DN15834_c0_g1_i1.p1  ORF type:complete len:189 (+),score=19.33 TRINITY_DN15834_c0_g1_i1:82-648(+)
MVMGWSPSQKQVPGQEENALEAGTSSSTKDNPLLAVRGETNTVQIWNNTTAGECAGAVSFSPDSVVRIWDNPTFTCRTSCDLKPSEWAFLDSDYDSSDSREFVHVTPGRSFDCARCGQPFSKPLDLRTHQCDATRNDAVQAWEALLQDRQQGATAVEALKELGFCIGETRQRHSKRAQVMSRPQQTSC